MARYRATIETERSPEDAFAYLSDFCTTAEWDPGVVEAERVNGSALGAGAQFRLLAEFLGRRIPLTYRVVEYDPPHAVAFLGENATVTSHDRIAIEATGGGARVTYDADLRLKGPRQIADPLLKLAFNRTGDRALAGLERALVRPPAGDTLRRPAEGTLLRLSGRSLEGRSVELPDDLDAWYTFLIVAFRREQQALVDGWLPWLSELEQRRDDVAVYEVPVLPSIYTHVRRLVDAGMTRGIHDPAARARTVTVYTDVDKVLDNLGLDATDTTAVALIERPGRILARETGGFDRLKARRLAAALAPAPAMAAS